MMALMCSKLITIARSRPRTVDGYERSGSKIRRSRAGRPVRRMMACLPASTTWACPLESRSNHGRTPSPFFRSPPATDMPRPGIVGRALAKLSKNLPRPLFLLAPRTLTTLTSSSSSLSHSLTSPGCDSTITHSTNTCFTGRTLLRSPWSAIQQRGAVVHGADVKPGNVIARNDRIYQVLKADHSHEGRGKAVVKVEVRDVDSGNKTSLRLLTDEQIDKVFVESKTYVYMCTDRDGIVVLIDPDTLDQLDVPEDFFGKKAKYLQEEMKVTVELYNDKPLSVKVPKHVTCVVKEAQNPVRGTAQAPKEILAVMENGFTVKVPPHIVEGEAVVVDTDDDSYVKRAKP